MTARSKHVRSVRSSCQVVQSPASPQFSQNVGEERAAEMLRRLDRAAGVLFFMFALLALLLILRAVIL